MSFSPSRAVHKVGGRGAARLFAVQALYQMDVAGTPLNEVLAQFGSHWRQQEIEGERLIPAQDEFFQAIVRGVLEEQAQIDPQIDQVLAEGWPLARIEAVLRAILRSATWELRSRLDIPVKVVLAEYVDLAAAFLDQSETAMANAVLEGVARRLRDDGRAS